MRESFVLPRLALFCVPLLAWAVRAEAQTFRPLEPADPLAAQMAGFGAAIAIGDGVVFIGEPQNTLRPGMVYVYGRGADGAWVERTQLRASDAENSDGFGASLAVEGGTLVVGAAAQNGGTGAVYIFERSGDAWRQALRLVPADGAAGDAFGASLALSGDFLLVGAPGQMERKGAVYVYRREGGTWSAAGKLEASDGAAQDVFGSAIAVANGRALIGAARKGDGLGAVYAFRLEGDAWRETGRLEARGLDAPAGFGGALAMRGAEAFVGAPLAGGSIGAVYAFRLDEESGEWESTARLTAFDGGRRTAFGASIAPTGDALWVGAPGASRFQGAVYVFEGDGSGEGWLASRKLGAEGIERGDAFAAVVAASDELAVVGVVGADNGAGTAIVFEPGAAEGQWIQRNTLLSEPEEMAPVVGGAVACRDGMAAIYDCKGVELVAFLPISAIGGDRGTHLNDIWGWTDPETGHEYALVGRTDGTAFVDITDPENPVYVGDLPRTEGSPESSWRDIKVYKDHAFIVADAAGEHGMQVFDLTRLREYAGQPITFDPDTTYHRIHSAHNIAINTETGFAYPIGSSSGGETCGGGLHMIDIRDPENPVFAGCFADPQTGRAGTGYSHDAQCVVYHGPDQDYQGHEICIGFNETAVSIADVTDKKNPIAVSRVSYPNVAYTHQGWFTEDQRYLYMDDELDELQGGASKTRTLIWDLTDLDDPQLLAQHLGTTAATDHNLYIRGNLMYQSNYSSGLRILDISDPANPVEVGYLDVAPYAANEPGFHGSWSNYPFFESGVIAVSGIEQGLFLIRKTPGRPTS
ncbi:MAG TPA: choice-of-anchor B family protein [Longimicrobiales bacterium]